MFTCDYGACINKNLECDGKADCRDGSDENTFNCRTTYQVTPECRYIWSILKKICSWNKTFRTGEFKCRSGQCIDQDYACDGRAECDDQSDETEAACWHIKCPRFTYQCKYGACANSNAECNGIVDCFDGSDEDPNICAITPVKPPLPPGVKYGSHFLKHCLNGFVLGVAAFCHNFQNLENGRLYHQTLLDFHQECQ